MKTRGLLNSGDRGNHAICITWFFVPASYIFRMCRSVIALVILFAFLVTPVFAIDGTFQGKVVNPPVNEPSVPGWIYVQGRNQLVRRVEVSHAEIVFSGDVPVAGKHRCNADCLSPGQEIRVTAEQDRSGEWRAKRVEILKVTTNRI